MKSIPENYRTVNIGSAFVEHLRATGTLAPYDGQRLPV
jgi:hypothetical protein